MKKYTLLFFIVLAFSFKQGIAQSELWGMTYSGGQDYLGTIFKTNPDGTGLSLQYSFSTNFGGAHPAHTRLLEVNGKMLGMTYNGGAKNKGVIFQFDPATNAYLKRLNFHDVDNVGFPTTSFTQDANGRIFGVSASGGANGIGVLFEFNPSTGEFIKKIDFEASSGSYPEGSLLLSTNGKLYGVTQNGGANGLGVLFEYDPTNNTYTKKIDFDGTNGASPQGNELIQASNGKLYGMTYGGGANSGGILFEYDTSMNSLVKKIDFDGTNKGSHPQGSLLELSNGLLYGMTYEGGSANGGILFEYDFVHNTFTKKIDFSGANGKNPLGSLTKATNGKLYGLTGSGGNGSKGALGTLFEYDPTGGTLITTVNFTNDSNGYLPQGSLVLSSNGKLYGMNSYGGASNDGVIFEYDATTSAYSKKIDFNYAPGGMRPTNDLTLYKNKFYGMTPSGGANGVGALFEFDLGTKTYTKKIDFNATSFGANPNGGLILLSDKFYGVTRNGGSNGNGVLFQYDPATNTLQKKIDFDGTNTGSFPYGNLTLSADGKLLYGLTDAGGANALGALFQYDPATNSLIKKVDFDGSGVGSAPQGSLVLATNGKMYGMTGYGGINDFGVLFEYDPIGNSVVKKFDFTSSSGRNPFGNLTLSSNGKLYGLTLFGGANDRGTLFEYDFALNSFTKKIDLDYSTKGANPYGSLTESSNGKLYGMTAIGGTNSFGVLFEYDPSSGIFTDRFDFDETNGAIPQLGSSLVKLTFSSQTITFNALSSKTYGDAPFDITASSTSGLPMTYTSADPTIASVNGSTITILKAGSVKITAKQSGNYTTSPAVDASQTLTINKAKLTLTAKDTTKIYGTANPNFTISYSGFVGKDDATVIDTLSTISTKATKLSDAGKYAIHLSGGYDNNYSFTLMDGTLTITQAEQTIQFSALPDKTMGDSTFTLSATASSGLEIAYTAGTKVSLNGKKVTLVSPGRETIVAAQSGNTSYKAAKTVSQSFCIKPTKPSITILTVSSGATTLTSSASTGNQWYYNGSTIAGETNASLIATANGKYTVQVHADDCLSKFSDEVSLIITGDISQLNEAIALYPNPSHDYVFVRGLSQTSVESHFTDVMGRTYSIPLERQEDLLKADIQQLSGGLYLLKIVEGNRTHIFKIMKQ